MEILRYLFYIICSLLGVYLAGITIKWLFYCGTKGICEGRKQSIKEQKNEERQR